MPRMLSLVIACILIMTCLASAKAPWQEKDFAVVGYLPEYRLGGFDYEAAFQAGLTHLLFFSLEIDEKGLPTALDRLPTKEAARAARAAADKVGGKILISFGGNSRSQNFGEMATSNKRRKAFLDALNTLMVEYGFDGVDYNWEYPRNHGEWRAWGTLMDETRHLLSGTAIVTFTMYLDPHHYDVIMRYKLLDRADYVHCMAYDQHRQHSTFAFFKSGIRHAKDKGFDLKKFTIGLPFYSRDVHTGEPKTYAELHEHLENEVDDQIGAHYFNSRATIAKKTRTAADAGLGGVMIWELGQDLQPLNRKESLMTSLRDALPWKVPTEPPASGDASGDL